MRTDLKSAPIPVSLFISISGIDVNPLPELLTLTAIILPPRMTGSKSAFPASKVSVEL